MVISHRDETFGLVKGRGYLWCLHCERCYESGKWREVADVSMPGGVMQMCPYNNCDGDAVIDTWDWEYVRRENGYPVVPVPGIVYPLYPDRS